MLITRSTLGLVGFFVVAVLGIVLWQPGTKTIAKETKPPVAPGSAGGLPKVKATEDTESTEKNENGEEKGDVQRIPFVVDIPEKIQDKSNYRPWMGILEEQGFKSTINVADSEDGKYVKHELIIFVPAGSNPRVVWEEHSDGMRPRVILPGYVRVGREYGGAYGEAGPYSQRMRSRNPIKEPLIQGVTASNQPSPFPTLEAQRAADLAYKLLGVELEPLNKKELARVKAMKFAGGLRVTSGKNAGGMSPPLNYGDLLVGLHVWPTTSLADVKKVLERDDLGDLSPLKFYVIRGVPKNNGGYGEYGGGMGGEPKPKTIDQLVTGRIEVNIDAMKKKTAGNVIVPSGGGEYFGGPAPWPQSAPVPNRQPARDPQSKAPRLLDLEHTGHTHDTGHRYDTAIKPPQSTLPNSSSPYSAQPERSVLKSNASLKLAQVYEGKTFNQWRSQWKNELSIKSRTETVRAMAAFGNAGHGKEAAEVILEIVGEYDWKYVVGYGSLGTGPSPLGALQNACLSAFRAPEGEDVRPLPRKDAQEALLAAMHSENVRVRAFLIYVVPNYKSLTKNYQEHAEGDEELKKYMKPDPNMTGGLGGGGGGGGGTGPPPIAE